MILDILHFTSEQTVGRIMLLKRSIGAQPAIPLDSLIIGYLGLKTTVYIQTIAKERFSLDFRPDITFNKRLCQVWSICYALP